MNRFVKGLRSTAVAATVAVLVQTMTAVAWGPLADASSNELSATTAVNVRTGPSTSSAKLGTLRRGEKVQVISKRNGWATVKWNGKTAYVSAAYLTAPRTPSPTVTVPAATGSSVTTARLNLRSGPSLGDRVVTVVNKGTALRLTGRVSGSYTAVQHGNQTLWAATSYLTRNQPTSNSPLPTAAGKIKATTALMIRTSPDRSFRSLGDVPRGTVLDATGKQTGGMAEVIWQGNLRWVNARFTVKADTRASQPAVKASKSTPTTSQQYATANLNLWKASTGQARTSEIPRGSAVAVTGVVRNGRAQVIHNGVERWVTARYLAATAPSAPAALSNLVTDTKRTGINKGWSSGLEKTNSWVQKIAWHVWDNYPTIITQYGWRRDVTPDHPGGRAVDVMIPRYKQNQALGWEIANYFRAHAREFNINYIIFGQKIWSVSRDKEGWRPMSSRGNDTANHYDHVHINTYGPNLGKK